MFETGQNPTLFLDKLPSLPPCRMRPRQSQTQAASSLLKRKPKVSPIPPENQAQTLVSASPVTRVGLWGLPADSGPANACWDGDALQCWASRPCSPVCGREAGVFCTSTTRCTLRCSPGSSLLMALWLSPLHHLLVLSQTSTTYKDERRTTPTGVPGETLAKEQHTSISKRRMQALDSWTYPWVPSATWTKFSTHPVTKLWHSSQSPTKSNKRETQRKTEPAGSALAAEA